MKWTRVTLDKSKSGSVSLRLYFDFAVQQITELFDLKRSSAKREKFLNVHSWRKKRKKEEEFLPRRSMKPIIGLSDRWKL